MIAQDLARILQEVLELPSYKDIRVSKGAKIVKAIQKAMTNALLRGEDIHIVGLGKFKVRTKKATRSPVPLNHHDIGDLRGHGHPPKTRAWTIRDIPERKYVHFQPSKELIRYINGNPQSS